MNLYSSLMQADFLVSFPGLGIQELPVSRVVFEIFGYPVYWYGLLIAAAIIVCLTLAASQAEKHRLKSDDILDTFILLIPMMIIFARLYYVIGAWEDYAGNWRRVIDINHGGLAFYGGVIGGIIAIVIIALVKKIKIWHLLDHLAVYVPLGQAIGRWGNFFNQEAFGNNTTLPWGMYSNQTAAYLTRIGGHDPASPVHPTFLYEFIGNLIIFALLLRIRKSNKTPFRITLYYFLFYGLLRFFVERIRTDPLYIPGTGMRISLILSAVMVIGSVVALIILRQRMEKLAMARALAGEPEDPDEISYSLNKEKRDRQQVDAKQSKAAADLQGTERERAFIPLEELDDDMEALDDEDDLEAEAAESDPDSETKK